MSKYFCGTYQGRCGFMKPQARNKGFSCDFSSSDTLDVSAFGNIRSFADLTIAKAGNDAVISLSDSNLRSHRAGRSGSYLMIEGLCA